MSWLFRFFFLTGLLTIPYNAFSQTIHIDDFNFFVGCFATRDSGGQNVIDCSKFTEWHFIKPGSDSGWPRESVKHDPGKHWVYDWQPYTEQAGQIKWSGKWKYANHERIKYRFYIMMDFFGHELQRNVLTVWKEVGCDSLEYVCGQAKDFDTGIGHAGVKLVTFFPDSSFLLIVDRGGEGHSCMSFYRGSEPCHFEKFYENQSHWHDSETNRVTYSYDFSQLVSLHGDYEVEELKRYERIFLDGNLLVGKYQSTTDSMFIKSLNLWIMAKDYFGLDSLHRTE